MSVGNVPFPISADGWVMTHYPAVPTDDGLLITGERFAASSASERPPAEAPQAIGGTLAAPRQRREFAHEEALAGAA